MEQHGRRQMEPELVLLNYCKRIKSLFTFWDFIIGTQSYRPVRYSIVKIIIFLRVFVLNTCFTSYAKAPSWNMFISVFQKQMKTRSAVQLAFLFLLLKKKKKNSDLNRSPESCIAADWNKKKNYTSNWCGVWKCQLVGMQVCGRLLGDAFSNEQFLSLSKQWHQWSLVGSLIIGKAKELLLQLQIEGGYSHRP